MKINGKEVIGNMPEVVVIPKGNEEFVFKATAILSYDEFDKLCPMPQPPTITKPGGVSYPNYDDKKYEAAVDEWATRKNAWMVLESLKVTDGLEWSTVVAGDPATWPNYMDELKLVFTAAEINCIIDLIFVANGLDQKKIDEATKRFLAGEVKGQDE